MYIILIYIYSFPGGTVVKIHLPVQLLQETWVQYLGQEYPLYGNPFKYSCLESPMDRGVWRATVHRIIKLDTTEVTEQIYIYIYISG